MFSYRLSRFITVALIGVGLMGCNASQPTQPTTNSVAQSTQPANSTDQKAVKDAMVMEFVGAVINQKVKTNGVEMLCAMPAFTECFNRTQAQCESNLAANNTTCFDKASKSFAIDSRENVGNFFASYAMCHMMYDVLKNPANMAEVSQCFKDQKVENGAFDQQKMMEILMK